MAWIAHWLNRHSGNKSAREQLRTGGAAACRTYSPELVPSMLEDHDEMLEMLDRINALSAAGELEAIPALLGRFKARLDDHALKENVPFYGYVEQNLSSQPFEIEILNHFRHEMSVIGRKTLTFVREWQASGVTPTSAGDFSAELAGIKALLVERMQRETASLYPLYRPAADSVRGEPVARPARQAPRTGPGITYHSTQK